MADPFGRLEPDDQIAPDYLGAMVPVAFGGQPALPVTGGPAVGSPVGPTTVGGGGFAPTAPSTVTGQPTLPVDATTTGDGGQAGGPNPLGFIDPAIKLGNIAQKIFGQNAQTMTPGGSVGAISTPSGQLTTTAPDVLRDQQFPDAGATIPDAFADTPPSLTTPDTTTGPQWPQVGLGTTPDAPGIDAPAFDFGGTTAPLPDTASAVDLSTLPQEFVDMLGGDRAAIEGALGRAAAQITPQTVIDMADAGELTGLGIGSAAQLTPDTLANLSTGIGIAGMVLTGLKLAGVAEGEAARVAGSLLSMASTAMTGLALTAQGTMGASLAAMSTMGAISSIAGGVTAIAAPFIAWGMHALESSMRPNTLAPTRRLNAEIFQVANDQAAGFNALVDKARAAGVSDPATLNMLLNAGQDMMLWMYNTHVGVGDDLGIPGIGRDASASGHIGGFDPTMQGELMAPFRQAMMNIAALDQQLGGQARGRPDWYGIFGGQLNPWSLNEAQYGPGAASANPLGLNAAQYGERFTPEQLRAAAGGLDPLDFALQQYAASSPDWNVVPWTGAGGA